MYMYLDNSCLSSFILQSINGLTSRYILSLSYVSKYLYSEISKHFIKLESHFISHILNEMV